MLNKTKLGLAAAAAAMFTVSAFAEEGRHGFYVELETTETPVTIQKTKTYVTFCEAFEREDARYCVTKKLDDEDPTFIPFYEENAFLKQLKIINAGKPSDTDTDTDSATVYIAEFDRPFEDCTVDATTQVWSNQKNGKGYAFLELTIGEDLESEDRLNCDNGSVFFPGKK